MFSRNCSAFRGPLKVWLSNNIMWINNMIEFRLQNYTLHPRVVASVILGCVMNNENVGLALCYVKPHNPSKCSRYFTLHILFPQERFLWNSGGVFFASIQSNSTWRHMKGWGWRERLNSRQNLGSPPLKQFSNVFLISYFPHLHSKESCFITINWYGCSSAWQPMGCRQKGAFPPTFLNIHQVIHMYMVFVACSGKPGGVFI